MPISNPLDVLREKADLFVLSGFRDEDGVWHDGPHCIEFDAALAQLEALVEEASMSVDIGDEMNRCRICWEVWGEHTYDCPVVPFLQQEK